MPAAVSGKPQQIAKENFAIRGLHFFGFVRARRTSVTSTTTKPVIPVKPQFVVQVEKPTIASLSKSTNDLLDNNATLAPPPPPYLSSSSSHGSLTSSDEESNISKRRTRRLSKMPPPSPTSHDQAHIPSSPLAKMSSVSSPSLIPSAPVASTTTTTTTSSANASTTPSPRRNTKHKSGGSVDSSGRPRPPVSGVRSSSPNNNSGGGAAPAGHTYHYKRARAPSTSDVSKRTQDAVLCLEALLDAYESGAVEDMRHVIEQVTVARKILIGEDDAIGLAQTMRSPSAQSHTGVAGNGSGNANGSVKLPTSSSVTSLATLANLVS